MSRSSRKRDAAAAEAAAKAAKAIAEANAADAAAGAGDIDTKTDADDIDAPGSRLVFGPVLTSVVKTGREVAEEQLARADAPDPDDDADPATDSASKTDSAADSASDIDSAAESASDIDSGDPDEDASSAATEDIDSAVDSAADPAADPAPEGDAETDDVGQTDDVAKPIGTGSVEDLRDRLVELQSTVEQLVAKAQPTPETSGDPEIDSASRTLRFAEQTADAVVGEAREEAAAIVADAERQRSEIIRRARQQADQDYTAERDRVVAASVAWQAQRSDVLRQLEALTSVFAQYQDGLGRLDGTVSTVTNELRTGIASQPTALTPPSHGLLEDSDDPEANGLDSDAWLDADHDGDDTSTDPADAASGSDAALRPVGADSDPFMFDAAELPETTGDFGWEAEGPSSTTF